MEGQDAKQAARAVLQGLMGPAGDLGEMAEALPQLSAYVTEYAAPEFQCAMVPVPPTPPVVYDGVGGLQRAWDDWGETFTSLRAVLDDVRESESHIVLLVEQIGITRHGGVQVTQPSAMVWEFRGGQVVRAEFHLDRAEALRVAGL